MDLVINAVTVCSYASFCKTAYLYILNSLKSVFLDVYSIHDIYLLKRHNKYEYVLIMTYNKHTDK